MLLDLSTWILRSALPLVLTLGLPSCGGGADRVGRGLSEAARGSRSFGDGALHVTWMGTAGVYLSDGEHALLIDPFVSRYRLFDVVRRRDLAPKGALVDTWLR